MEMIIGRRYKLPHGIGVLIAREIRDPDRPGHLKQTTDLGRWSEHDRYIFELEKPHGWAFEDSQYAAWGKQIQEIES